MTGVSDLLSTVRALVEVRTVVNPNRGEKPSPEAVRSIKEIVDGVTGIDTRLVERGGYFTILGELGDGGRPIILLLAHFDTVPADPSEWSTDPFELVVVGGRAYGRGALDDKSNVAVLSHVVADVGDELEEGKLIFAFTGDEEVGGVNGALALREMLKSAGLLPDYVINGDGFGLAPIVRRRNAFVATIRIPRKPVSVKGKLRVKRVEASIREKESRHAAYFMPGVDTHPMIALAEHLLYHPDTYVVSIRGAWVKENVVPSWVEAVLVDAGEDAGEEVSADLNLTRLIRSLIPLTRAAIDTEMHSDFGVTITPNLYEATDDAHVLKLDVRAMVSERTKVESQLSDVLMEVLDDADVSVEGGSGYLYTPSDARIVAEAAKVLDELGLPVRFIEACGASDSRFFSPLSVDCLDFGPLGGNVHGPNEYVIVDSLKHAYEFYARLIRRLSGKGRRGAQR